MICSILDSMHSLNLDPSLVCKCPWAGVGVVDPSSQPCCLQIGCEWLSMVVNGLDVAPSRNTELSCFAFQRESSSKPPLIVHIQLYSITQRTLSQPDLHTHFYF